MPTEYIDSSTDPEVAGAFAVKDSSAGRRARVYLVDVQRSEMYRSEEVAEFYPRYCVRTDRQKARGYGPISFRDLQSQEAVQHAGVQWFEVTVSEADVERFGKRHKELVDTHSDPGAGLVRWRVNCYVSETGKLRPGVATWISRRIPMVPLVARDMGRHSDFWDTEFQPPGDLRAWSEAREREASLRYWSEDFSDRLPQGCGVPCIDGKSGLLFYPGTYHPISQP
jgi:hypothetical protein